MFFVYSPIIRNSLFLFLFSLFSNNLFTASKPSKPPQEVNSELKTCLREKRECIVLKNRTLDLNKSCNESKNNCENEKDTIDVSKKQCENQLLKCTNEETSYLSEKNNCLKNKDNCENEKHNILDKKNICEKETSNCKMNNSISSNTLERYQADINKLKENTNNLQSQQDSLNKEKDLIFNNLSLTKEKNRVVKESNSKISKEKFVLIEEKKKAEKNLENVSSGYTDYLNRIMDYSMIYNELKKELLFSTFYYENTIMQKKKKVITSMMNDNNSPFLKKTATCILYDKKLRCFSLKKLIALFPSQKKEMINNIENSFTKFSASLAFDPGSPEALYQFYLRTIGRMDCLPTENGSINISLGSIEGNTINTDISLLSQNNSDCGPSLGNIGRTMSGMSGASGFNKRFNEKKQSAYEACMKNLENTRLSHNSGAGTASDNGGSDCDEQCKKDKAQIAKNKADASAAIAEGKQKKAERLRNEAKAAEKEANEDKKNLENAKRNYEREPTYENAGKQIIADSKYQSSKKKSEKADKAAKSAEQEAHKAIESSDIATNTARGLKDEWMREREKSLGRIKLGVGIANSVVALGVGMAFNSNPLGWGITFAGIGILEMVENSEYLDAWDSYSGGGLYDQNDPDSAGLDPNDPSYCVLKAEIDAWTDAFSQWDYDGCNSNVTPNPDDDSGRCYNQYSSRDTNMTPEERATARCHIQGMVAESNDEGSFDCVSNPIIEQELTFQNYNACQDPRALCVEEDITPGGEVPTPSPGPTPIGEGVDPSLPGQGGGRPPITPPGQGGGEPDFP